MTRTRVTVLTLLALVLVFFGTSAQSCSKSDEMVARDKLQEQKKQAGQTSTEAVNLKAKYDLEKDPNRIGYVYLLSFGKPFGYYVAKGKISSNGSQLTPENDIVNTCYAGSSGTGTDCNVVTDGPQDDGTYGEGDPGIFFFLSDGKTMVHTNLDYFYSTRPIPTALEIPKLG